MRYPMVPRFRGCVAAILIFNIHPFMTFWLPGRNCKMCLKTADYPVKIEEILISGNRYRATAGSFIK